MVHYSLDNISDENDDDGDGGGGGYGAKSDSHRPGHVYATADYPLWTKSENMCLAETSTGKGWLLCVPRVEIR